jgi:hypothetical protein
MELISSQGREIVFIHENARWYQGVQKSECVITTKPHMSCECEDSAELRFRCLGKHFTEPSDHYRVPLCRTLCFVGGSEILAEEKKRMCARDSLRSHPT